MIFDSECHTAGKAGKATHPPKVHREPLFVPKVFDARAMEGFPPGTRADGRPACLVEWMDRFGSTGGDPAGTVRQTNARIVEAISRVPGPPRRVGHLRAVYLSDRTSPRQTRAALDELDRGTRAAVAASGRSPCSTSGCRRTRSTWRSGPARVLRERRPTDLLPHRERLLYALRGLDLPRSARTGLPTRRPTACAPRTTTCEPAVIEDMALGVPDGAQSSPTWARRTSPSSRPR